MNIVIYTIPDCPYSKELKEYLSLNAIAFTEKDVSTDKDNLSEMLDASDKFAGVPFTLITKDSGEKVALKGFTKSDFDVALGLSVSPESMKADMSKPDLAPTSDVVVDPVSMDAMSTKPDMPTQQDVSSIPPVMPSAMPSDMSVGANAPTPSTSTPSMNTSSTPDPQAELNSLLKDLETKVAQGGQTGPANDQPVITIPSTPVVDTSAPVMGTSMGSAPAMTPATPSVMPPAMPTSSVAPTQQPVTPTPSVGAPSTTPAVADMPAVPDFGTKL